jgi:uncharacterized membrane protein
MFRIEYKQLEESYSFVIIRALKENKITCEILKMSGKIVRPLIAKIQNSYLRYMYIKSCLIELALHAQNCSAESCLNNYFN